MGRVGRVAVCCATRLQWNGAREMPAATADSLRWTSQLRVPSLRMPCCSHSMGGLVILMMTEFLKA
eukprot:364527-Chlamydomonas_euryale.AAC.5